MQTHIGFRSRSGRCLPAVAILSISFLSCGQDDPQRPVYTNGPPAVSNITLSQERVHAHQSIVARVSAADPDGDLLGYRWSATRGTFPDGRVLRSARWLTASTRGTDTVRVTVNDREHTAQRSLAVTMTGLAEPPSLGFVLSASSAELRWNASSDEGIDDWRGYEIFQANRSFDQIPADSFPNYVVALDSSNVRSSVRTGLRRGTRYYFRIGSLRSWEGLEERSPLSVEVDLAPRPEGIVQLSELAAPAGGLALDFSSGRLLPLDPSDVSGIAERDVYIGSSDPMDGDAPLYLKSVSRLANRNPAWAGRAVSMKPIGEDWTVNSVSEGDWTDQVPVVNGSVIALRLPEGNYAKVQLLVNAGSPGAWPFRWVQLHWAYQTLPDYPVF